MSVYQKLRQEIENFYLDQPYSLADYYAAYFLRETSWTPKEKLVELDCTFVYHISCFATQ